MGTLLLSSNVDVNLPLTNQGALTAASGNNDITGMFTQAAGASLTVGSGAGGGGLTIANGFTNFGTSTITLTNDVAFRSASLTVSGGTLVNQGTIESLPGAGNGSRTLTAVIDNQATGNVVIDQATTINAISGASSNAGLIDVNADLTISLSGTSPSFTNTATIDVAAGATLTINQSGTSPSFTNTGTITGDDLTINGGVFTTSQPLNAGTVEVIGLVALGKTDREIAEELFISIKTVGNHVSNILNKTSAANRTEATSYAHTHGLVGPNSEGEE